MPPKQAEQHRRLDAYAAKLDLPRGQARGTRRIYHTDWHAEQTPIYRVNRPAESTRFSTWTDRRNTPDLPTDRHME